MLRFFFSEFCHESSIREGRILGGLGIRSTRPVTGFPLRSTNAEASAALPQKSLCDRTSVWLMYLQVLNCFNLDRASARRQCQVYLYFLLIYRCQT